MKNRISPNKIGRPVEATQPENIISTHSRFSILEEKETTEAEEKEEVVSSEIEDGEIQVRNKMEQKQTTIVKLDDPGTRVSLHRASKSSHKFISDPHAPNTKYIGPSDLGKRRPIKDIRMTGFFWNK